jgi:hypothetical protein
MTQGFFSRGSRACQHASPRCIDHTLGGSAANRGFTNLAQQLGATRTYPQVRVTQWHEQFTRATFWLFVGEGTISLTSNRSEPEIITNFVVFAQLPKGVHKYMRVQESGHGRPPPLFIVTHANRVVIPLGAAMCEGTGQAMVVPQRSTSVTRQGVSVATQPNPCFPSSLEN